MRWAIAWCSLDFFPLGTCSFLYLSEAALSASRSRTKYNNKYEGVFFRGTTRPPRAKSLPWCVCGARCSIATASFPRVGIAVPPVWLDVRIAPCLCAGEVGVRGKALSNSDLYV